jgi:hypothetical protein
VDSLGNPILKNTLLNALQGVTEDIFQIKIMNASFILINAHSDVLIVQVLPSARSAQLISTELNFQILQLDV